MKIILNRLPVSIFLCLFVFLFSCKKEENKIFYKGGTAPVLTSNDFVSPMVLDTSKRKEIALILYWTNPDYKFTTGVSSQNVTYTIQFDTTGGHFATASIDVVAVSNDLQKVFTVSDLNTALLSAGLKEDISHNVEIRIKSNMANASASLYSNILSLTVTPFLDVVYPVPDKLYITGSATPRGWQCACGDDGDGETQRLTKVNSSQFEIVIDLSGGNSYLFIPVWSNWDHKYGGTGSANNTNAPAGDTFMPEGRDLLAPANSGTYKIVVDFKTGKFSVTPQ